MALTFRDRFKHNLFIWFFGLTKVRLILFCRPKIVDINDDEVILCIPLNRQTRNHVNSMYIGAMTVGADLVTGITAMLNIRKSKRNIVLIFKDINAKFFKRAEGNTHFICNYKKEIEQWIKAFNLEQVERFQSLQLFLKNLAMNPLLSSRLPYQ